MNIFKKICTIFYKTFKYIILGIISPYIILKRYINNKTNNIKIWQYQAITNDNKEEIDYIKADSREMVENLLITENKKIVSIKSNKRICYLYRHIADKKLNKKELVFFLVQLTTYLKAENNLIESLSLVIKKTKDNNLKRVIRLVRYSVMSGNSLASALEKQGNAFPKLLIQVLNNKDHNIIYYLNEMKDYYKELYLSEKTIQKTNVYRIIIIPYVLLVVNFVLYYVIPQFYNSYAILFNKRLTFLEPLLSFNKYSNYCIIFIVFLIVVTFVFIIINSMKKTQFLIMKIPGIRNLIIDKEMIIYAKTMSLMVKYNITSNEVFDNTTDNYEFQKLIVRSCDCLKYDHVFSQILKDVNFFPVKAYEMILVGEKFDSVLLQINNIANYYQNKINRSSEKIISIVGPILVIMSTILFSSILLTLFSQYIVYIK